MFGNDWDEILQDEMQKPYFIKLMDALTQEYKEHTVYPPKELLFTALKLTPYKEDRSSYFRSRSLSWSRTSARTKLLCQSGGTYPSVTAQYLCRAEAGRRCACSKPRLFAALSRAGSVVAEHRADGT